MGERMAAVETWQSQHEQRCEERQVSMGREIGRLTKGAWGLVFALLAWSLGQLYANATHPQVAPTPALAASER